MAQLAGLSKNTVRFAGKTDFNQWRDVDQPGGGVHTEQRAERLDFAKSRSLKGGPKAQRRLCIVAMRLPW